MKVVKQTSTISKDYWALEHQGLVWKLSENQYTRFVRENVPEGNYITEEGYDEVNQLHPAIKKKFEEMFCKFCYTCGGVGRVDCCEKLDCEKCNGLFTFICPDC